MCELEGSLTAPLGHYMVLGTANYVSEGTQPPANARRVGRQRGKAAPGGRGGEGGGGQGRDGGGDYGGEFGGEYGGMGGFGGEFGAPAPRPTLTTSRFAFVIQVVEGGSYAPEK